MYVHSYLCMYNHVCCTYLYVCLWYRWHASSRILYTCESVCIHVFTCTPTHVVCSWVYVCVCVCARVSVCVRMRMRACARVCACVFVRVPARNAVRICTATAKTSTSKSTCDPILFFVRTSLLQYVTRRQRAHRLTVVAAPSPQPGKAHTWVAVFFWELFGT